MTTCTVDLVRAWAREPVPGVRVRAERGAIVVTDTRAAGVPFVASFVAHDYAPGVAPATAERTGDMSLKRGYCTLRATIPPKFNGLIGSYPQTVFRPESVEARAVAGVSFYLDGTRVEFDGAEREIEAHRHTLGVGELLAFHVESTRDEAIEIEIVVRGVSIDVSGELNDSAFTRLGPLAQMVTQILSDNPEPEESEEGEPPASEPASESVFDARAMFTAGVATLVTLYAPKFFDHFLAAKPERELTDETWVTRQTEGLIAPPPGDGWRAVQSLVTEQGCTTVWRRTVVKDAEATAETLPPPAATTAEADAARAAE